MGKTSSARNTLIGGGISNSLAYPLSISGTLQNGDTFSYSEQISIKPPAPAEMKIDLALIHEVKVSLLKSNPVQVGVYIKGGLRDGCTTFHNIELIREGHTINIKITTQHPQDVFCPAIYTYFEKDVNPGSDFITATTYSLNVDNYSTTFNYSKKVLVH